MKRVELKYLNLPITTWLKVIILISVISGLTSLIFLHFLNVVTQFRESHSWIMYFLPLAGLFIIAIYRKYGPEAKHGINLLFEEYYKPKNKVRWTMTPLILISTLVTHLFGGSAGREGTSIQFGGTYGYRIAKWMALDQTQSRVALIAGIAAGLSSLFGTPLAGAIFAFELMRVGKLRYKALPIALCTAYLSYYTCVACNAPHTKYMYIHIDTYWDLKNLWIIPVAIICGTAALLYRLSGDFWTNLFSKINNEYYRIATGSLLILLIVYLIGSTKFIGLGLPTIQSAFDQPLPGYYFLMKIILTTLTLSIGFQGGEVTPLFFIGATLTSFLSIYIPLPLMMLAGLGYVSAVAGATKTPFACSLMALEFFGLAIFPLAIITCFIATWSSGVKGIYSSQRSRQRWI